MAPKRAQKMEVRSTTKVVQESVQVSVVSSNKRVTRGKNDIQIGEVTIQAKEDASITTITTEDKAGQETKPNVPVQNETEEQKRDTDMGVNKEHVKKAKTQERNDGGKVKRKKKRGKRNGEGYQRYVYRVLKQVHPDMAISSKAMIVLNNLMNDMFERLAVEAAKLNTYTGHMTLSSREIQGAVKLVLPGELGKHAIAEGAKAVTNFISYDT